MKVIVGIADMRVANDPESTLITYALGSCIGVALYDPAVKVGGLLHYMLPESQLDPAKAQKNPCMFGDTGIPLLFREMYKWGAEKRRIVVKVAGGAQVMDPTGYFNIGKRNYTSLRKTLWMNSILIEAEAVGGNVNRTVYLEISSGKVWVKTSGDGEREI
ncbi:MAG: chemotaxis protein CheD [Deltaproteobacteria bacterium]|nr:chemotaxis protein CheD [Deltaproteobacteria bacterium]